MAQNVTLAAATLELTDTPSGTGTIDVGATVDGSGMVGDAGFAVTRQGNAPAYVPQTLDNLGVIAADVAGQTLTIAPTWFTNDGTITASAGAGLTITGSSYRNDSQTYTETWTNDTTGTISGAGAFITLAGSFTNAGTIKMAGGQLTLGQPGGMLVAQSGVHLGVTGTSDLQVSVELRGATLSGFASPTGTITIDAGVRVDGAGIVSDNHGVYP